MLYKNAVVIGVWTETALWGIFFVLYLVCVNVLVRRRGAESIQWIPLASATLLFALSTLHAGLQLRKLYTGLVQHAHAHGGPGAYFSKLNSWLNVTSDGVYASMILVGDSVVIHRCFLIWGKRAKVIVLPVLLLLGTAAAGYIAIWKFTTLHPGGTAFDPSIARSAQAAFLLSLGTNIVTTSLIAYRIITTARSVPTCVDIRPYMGGLVVVVESAAIYTCALLAFLIAYLSKSNAQYIIFCALCPIIGIVPTLIIVRVGLGLTRTSQVDVEEPPELRLSPSPPSPTCHLPYSSTDSPISPAYHITPLSSAYQSSPHTRVLSGSDTTWGDGPDLIHLQLRYSRSSGGRGVMSDDLSRNSSASFGLTKTKTNESK
ncbi:hypothetical protein BDV93DRAFT_519246 [Ceratobasidium sp. AG-I]|nr:hypothetical protein BDV93DRAFT_519246 [Ceratobasidium sp. AG-I]